MIRQIGLLLLLAAIAGGGYYGYQSILPVNKEARSGDQRRGGAGPAPVETETVDLTRIEDRIEAVGTTLAARAVEITAGTSGRIVEIRFKSGRPVAAGDVLIRLDDDIQRADVAEARARLVEATFARERAETLARSNTISKASIEQLTAALAIARAQADRADRRLADRRVTAPFAGTPGLTRMEVGSRVDDKTMITTLDDLSELEIEFSLPETVFGKAVPGLPVKATSGAFSGREFSGVITEIDSRIDTVSRSFRVRADLPNEKTMLPAGMFMHLTIVLGAREGPMIAEEAITVSGQSSFVFVVIEGKARRRDVTIGTREFGQVEITGGLVPGEIVVTRGLQRLHDGSPVQMAGGDGRPKTRPGNAGARGENMSSGGRRPRSPQAEKTRLKPPGSSS